MSRFARAVLVAAVAAVLTFSALATTGCAACSRMLPSSTQVTPVPSAVWPLLGTPAPSDGAIRVRVACVKVDNEPPARPRHAGVAAADVVYETPIEGGDTRYAALYQSQAPTKVGPVRSGRVSDTYIVPQYRALLARVGGDFVVETTIKQTPNLDDMSEFKVPEPYFRVGSGAPHNDFVSIPALRKAAIKRGFAPTADISGPAFGSAPASGTAATAVGITFSPLARVTWAWTPGAKRYRRAFNGSSAGDAGTNRPYEASNVVVLSVQRLRTKALDPAGNPTFDEVLVGSGHAVVFRGGRRYDGAWTAGRDAPPRLTAADGSEIALEPGHTWFEVVAAGMTLTSR